jgi:hypothetical protein
MTLFIKILTIKCIKNLSLIDVQAAGLCLKIFNQIIAIQKFSCFN